MKASTGRGTTVTLLALAVVLGLAACSGEPAESPASASARATSPDATAEPSHPSASGPTDAASATPSAEPDASASASGGGFPELAMIRAVNPGISLRAEPRLSGERLGSLAEGSRSVVLQGPVEADGHAWYLISGPGLPPASGCTTPLPTEPLSCPIWLGWAAAGPDDSWFSEDPTDCVDPASDFEAFAMMGDYEALHCYSGQELELVGWVSSYAGTPDPDPCPSSGVAGAPDWLWCHERWWEALYISPDQAIFVDLFVDPASGITIPHDGRRVAITGHIDDPNAPACTRSIPAGHPIYPEDAVRNCRAHFVVTGIQDAPAP